MQLSKIISLFSFAIVLSFFLSRPALASSAATKAEPDPLMGCELVQMNKIFGRMYLRICPAGISFKSGLLSGFVIKGRTESGKKNPQSIVTLVNDEAKTYREIPFPAFKRAIENIRHPILNKKTGEWETVYMSETPDKKMLGFDTYRLNYSLRLRVPPHVEFPDVMWITTDIPCSPDVRQFLETLFEHHMVKHIGIPLKMVHTVHLGPTKTEVTHDTVEATSRKFVKTDFQYPKDYRKAATDAEMFDFGLNMGF